MSYRLINVFEIFGPFRSYWILDVVQLPDQGPPILRDAKKIKWNKHEENNVAEYQIPTR